MPIKAYFPEESQVISHFFDIHTGVKSVWLKDNGIFIRAPKSDMPFNPLEVFNFIENPNVKIGENGLILLEAEALKPGSLSIPITDRLLECLPVPWIQSIKFALITAPFASQKFAIVRELRGVYIFHLLKPEYVADIRDEVLIAWSVEYEGKDFMSQIIHHRQPPASPEPKQRPKPKEIPPLRLVPKHKPFKPDRRKKKKAPPDVLKYFSRLKPRVKWRTTFKAMYKQAWHGDITKDKYYAGLKSHEGRYYSQGIDGLVNVTGQPVITVKRHQALMREHNIIQRRKQGFKGFGNAIYELPANLKHVMLWKRNPKTQEGRKGKAKPGRKPKN